VSSRAHRILSYSESGQCRCSLWIYRDGPYSRGQAEYLRLATLTLFPKGRCAETAEPTELHRELTRRKSGCVLSAPSFSSGPGWAMFSGQSVYVLGPLQLVLGLVLLKFLSATSSGRSNSGNSLVTISQRNICASPVPFARLKPGSKRRRQERQIFRVGVRDP
jgi:hypothetical protein